MSTLSHLDVGFIGPDAKTLRQMELLPAGQYVKRMGLMSLSLPLEDSAYDGFLGALKTFVSSCRDRWR